MFMHMFYPEGFQQKYLMTPKQKLSGSLVIQI